MSSGAASWRRPGPVLLASLLLASVLLVLAACGKPADTEHRQTLYVFGTLVEVLIRGAPEDKAGEAVAALDQAFGRMHRDWHAWKPGELTRVNRAFAEGRTIEVSDFVLPLILEAKEYERLSGGRFNAAIGGLIDAWGFHADELPKGALPDLDSIRVLAAARPSMDDVVIDGNRVSSTNPAVWLDFGGFAKGVALDRAMEILAAHGIENAIVNAGGDLNTMGDAGTRPWTVGIREPGTWGVIASVSLEGGEVLYTSGNYERYREHEGIRYAHILDPATGMPVDHIVSASVIATDGGLADAAATALTVAGPEGWPEVARAMGIAFAMLVDDKGRVHATRAMHDRLAFEPGQPTTPAVIVTP